MLISCCASTSILGKTDFNCLSDEQPIAEATKIIKYNTLYAFIFSTIKIIIHKELYCKILTSNQYNDCQQQFIDKITSIKHATEPIEIKLYVLHCQQQYVLK